MSSIDTEVAIVGGGLIGCMIAFYLHRRGRRVVVLERGMVGGESSGVSFGSLRLQGQHEAELPLALRAQEMWECIEADLGERVEFARHGHVHLALTPEQEERLDKNAAHGRAAGLVIERLGRAETARRWPFLSEQVRASSFSIRDAVVNPRLVAPAFTRAALRLGAQICEQTEVFDVAREAGVFVLRARGRDGASISVQSDVLVNAAGAWCGEIASRFDESIPVFAAGPAEMVTEPMPRFAAPVMHVVDGSILFRQTDRGNVVIGGHPRLSVDATTRRTRVPPEKLLTNLARLVAIAPHLRSSHIIRSWTGIEGYVADMMPTIGPSATTAGLFHACAFSGHGLQLGPAAALAIAELIVDGTTSMPIAPFNSRRFVEAAVKSHSLAEEFQGDVLARNRLT